MPGEESDMSASDSIFIHIVTFNNQATILKAIESLLDQSSYRLGMNLFLLVTDNASSDRTFDWHSRQALDTVQTKQE